MKDQKQQPTPRDLGLTSDSFSSTYPTETLPRTICNVEAKEKDGKTHWCLGAPGPIVVFNFDQGLEGVVEKFAAKGKGEGKRIIVAGMKVGPADVGKVFPTYHFGRPVPNKGESRKSGEYLSRVAKAATPIWEKFISDYMEFLDSDARTGIVDTATAAWALGKFAYLGMDKTTTADDPYGQKSGNLKSVFQGLVNEGLSHDKNVLWISRLKDEWKGGQPTGGSVLDGYGQLKYEVQLTVRLERKKVRGEKGRMVDVRTAEIRGCRIGDPELLEGMKLEGGDAEFKTLMSVVYGTDEEVWE